MTEQAKVLSVAIVGGGPGCKAIMDMIFAEKLTRLRIKLIGVASTNPEAVGYLYAKEKGIYTTRDYRDLYSLKGLNMIIELTGRKEVANEIARTKPGHVRLMDHIAARLFWDVFQLEEKRISERELAEAAFRVSEEKYRTVLEASPDPIVVYDIDGKVTYLNPTFTKVFGWTPKELLGKKLDYVPEKNWPETQMMISKVLAGESFSGVESRRYSKEGDILDATISAAVYLNTDGIPVGSVHILRDITDQKRAEERLKEAMAELERSNAELEQFAYVASHDLQEPLRKIWAFGDLLKARYAGALDERGCDYLDRMQNAARRMQALINDLLALSRITTKAKPFVPVNLADVVEEAVSDLELHIEQTGGRVEVGNMPTIDADPTQMRQLLQNLIDNALKFHHPEEKPVVKVYGQLLKEVCQITVEDNGIGFDEKYLDRIFAVCQRLHGRDKYAGTGLGLAICRKIVERHGGSITAKSTLGQGATFIMMLPVRHPKRGEVSNEQK